MSSDIAGHAALCRRALELGIALLTCGIVLMLVGVRQDERCIWLGTVFLSFGVLVALWCLAVSILIHERLLGLGSELEKILPDKENNN